jgi:hypothetical protein
MSHPHQEPVSVHLFSFEDTLDLRSQFDLCSGVEIYEEEGYTFTYYSTSQHTNAPKTRCFLVCPESKTLPEGFQPPPIPKTYPSNH